MSWNNWIKSIFERKNNKESGLDDNIKRDDLPEEFFERADEIRKGRGRRSFSQEEMLNHFDKMFKDMGDVFRQMNIPDVPDIAKMPDMPPNPAWEHGGNSSVKEDREIMYVPELDLPNSNSPAAPSQTFARFSRDPLKTDGYVIDTDIEKELERSIAISDYAQVSPIKPEPKQEAACKPSWFSHARPIGPGFHSMQPGVNSRVSVYTYSSSGGPGNQRVEERRTIENEKGEKEVTVTRRIGDQSQTLVTKQKPDGSEELIETSVNLDIDEKENFEKRWKTTALPEGSKSTPDNSVAKQQAGLEEAQRKSPSSNLFGSTFRGFPPSGRDED